MRISFACRISAPTQTVCVQNLPVRYTLDDLLASHHHHGASFGPLLSFRRHPEDTGSAFLGFSSVFHAHRFVASATQNDLSISSRLLKFVFSEPQDNKAVQVDKLRNIFALGLRGCRSRTLVLHNLSPLWSYNKLFIHLGAWGIVEKVELDRDANTARVSYDRLHEADLAMRKIDARRTSDYNWHGVRVRTASDRLEPESQINPSSDWKAHRVVKLENLPPRTDGLSAKLRGMARSRLLGSLRYRKHRGTAYFTFLVREDADAFVEEWQDLSKLWPPEVQLSRYSVAVDRGLSTAVDIGATCSLLLEMAPRAPKDLHWIRSLLGENAKSLIAVSPLWRPASKLGAIVLDFDVILDAIASAEILHNHNLFRDCNMNFVKRTV